MFSILLWPPGSSEPKLWPASSNLEGCRNLVPLHTTPHLTFSLLIDKTLFVNFYKLCTSLLHLLKNKVRYIKYESKTLLIEKMVKPLMKVSPVFLLGLRSPTWVSLLHLHLTPGSHPELGPPVPSGESSTKINPG